MTGKRSRSLIGKLSGILTPLGGSRTGLSDALPDSGTRSPRPVPGQFDPGAVGLGIAAVLGNSPAKNVALFRPVDVRRKERPKENYANGEVLPRRPSPKRRIGGDAFPLLGFLSSCDLCGKKLHGMDVYMYRGEKAFCSSDCRSNHMMNDERKDQNCRSETPKAVDLSPCPPYAQDQIFSAGILAI
ncbi:hypothetical protein MLD38_006963 [Melastoma candidum]|uniref:Uncharacterized protein n=1 Tax=Melastoma candidum TaxID=119954 RepID=A0ACB9RPA4_9MYRT|nr:hypothetical protein MLD38_006963 [Melastoma candidum]